jgi:aryl-alcohol dehydrogenase-like predicted oxidoreductase
MRQVSGAHDPIDRRPELHMLNLYQERQVWLLTYGTLSGGFLSDKYLGQMEPDRSALETARLKKYKQMIEAWGGWGLFQYLLKTLKDIVDKCTVSIANAATKYILDKPKLAGVNLSVRLGVSDQREDNARLSSLQLDGQGLERIDTILIRSKDPYHLIGDCGDEYRLS